MKLCDGDCSPDSGWQELLKLAPIYNEKSAHGFTMHAFFALELDRMVQLMGAHINFCAGVPRLKRKKCLKVLLHRVK